MMSQEITIEVCVDSVISALAAARGGADRIELCSSLIEGGVTPSAGLIEMVRKSVSLPAHVMIRPRGGDFFYDENEFEVMQREIALAKQLGVHGVVLGILDPDGRIDVQRSRKLVQLARPLAVTFHRAFDMTADLLLALEDICSTGADRLLTSGGEQTAELGIDTIAELVKKAEGRIVVMAGSGIKPENARGLADRTGVSEIHVGLRSSVESPMRFRNPRVSLGAANGREYDRLVVLEENVRRLREALQGSR
jgi:copper homeostasis protein